MDKEPQGAFLEVIERRRGKPDGSLSDDLVVPTEVRLNGQLLALPANYPIKIHEVVVSGRGDECVLATLTLFVKRLVIATEWPEVEVETERQVEDARRRGEDARRRLRNLGLIPDTEQSAEVA